MVLFGSIGALGWFLVVLAGIGGLIYYVANARAERKKETFERRKW